MNKKTATFTKKSKPTASFTKKPKKTLIFKKKKNPKKTRGSKYV